MKIYVSRDERYPEYIINFNKISEFHLPREVNSRKVSRWLKIIKQWERVQAELKKCWFEGNVKHEDS